MNRLELFNVLRPIVETVTGVSTVILSNQTQPDGTGIPSPSGEYITINPKQSVTQRGQANQYRTDSLTPRSIDVDIRAQIIVEADINVYRGVDAVNRLSKLQQCHKRPDILPLLFKAGVGWQRVSVPNDLTRMQSGNPEQRAQCYVYLMYETSDVITINNIESIDITMLDDNDRILYND